MGFAATADARSAETDWTQVVTLYDLLVALDPSPIVRLNRAVAVVETHGSDSGCPQLDLLATLWLRFLEGCATLELHINHPRGQEP